jgi:hypothetical protein
MTKSLALFVIGCGLAACGGGDGAAPGPDAAVGGDASACRATFSANFAETWAGPANCAQLATAAGDTTLQLAIPSTKLGTELAISFDLGASPTPGTYSTQNLVTPWSANATQELDMTACFYQAGTGAVPAGSFSLVLDALDPHPHGKLDLTLYVLSRPYTYCGETNTEQVSVTF